MKNIPYLLLSLLFLLSCTNRSFQIKGHIADEKLNGENVYLVPLQYAWASRVDSVIINNQEFAFNQKVDSTEIYIIRTKPLHRLHYQEILVVKESGTIDVTLDANSKAKGTPLNDTLQKWKDYMITFDSIYHNLWAKQKNSTKTDSMTIAAQLDSLRTINRNYQFQFVKNNQNNVVGQMVLRMQGGLFNPDQKKELELK